MAPAGQEREVTLDLTLDLTAGAAEQGAQFSVESELATMVSDEVDARCRAALSRARRRPRPSCCRNSVGLSVGRSNNRVSTFGTSTPSLNRSTVNTTFTRPAARSRRAAVRSSIGLSPQIATAGIPTARNCSAMKRAWPIDTQNPRALTFRGSPVLRRSSSTTRLAHA